MRNLQTSRVLFSVSLLFQCKCYWSKCQGRLKTNVILSQTWIMSFLAIYKEKCWPCMLIPPPKLGKLSCSQGFPTSMSTLCTARWPQSSASSSFSAAWETQWILMLLSNPTQTLLAWTEQSSVARQPLQKTKDFQNKKRPRIHLNQVQSHS